MKSLPYTSATTLVRTCFDDDAGWDDLVTAVTTTEDEDDFLADLTIVDDPEYRDLTPDQIRGLAHESKRLVIIGDTRAVTEEENPLLVLLLDDEEDVPQDDDGQPYPTELRVIAEELWSVENNISLANMDWDNFVDNADEDGVYRGF